MKNALRNFKLQAMRATVLSFFPLFLLLMSCQMAGDAAENKPDKPVVAVEASKPTAVTESAAAKTNGLRGIPLLERPIKVGVTFVLNKLNKIDEKAGTFDASIDLYLSWSYPSLAFDPKAIGTFRQVICFEEAEEKLKKIWDPRVVIVNINGKPTFDDKCLTNDANGDIVFIQRMTATFNTIYNLAAFPFDTQALGIHLSSMRYNTEELRFVQSQQEIYHSAIRDVVALQGWDIKNLDFVPTTIRGLDGHFFPEYKINIIIKRQPSSHLFALAPLLLIVLVPTILTLYAPKAEVGQLLGVWSGAILSLIALSFALNLRYPALGSDSLLAQLIAVIFSYEFLMICFTMTVFNPTLAACVKNPRLIPEIIKFMGWGIPLVFIIVVVVTILSTLFTI